MSASMCRVEAKSGLPTLKQPTSFALDPAERMLLFDGRNENCGNRLDCFGVAYGVLAACQLLGFKEKEVHLALSEDHAWVVYQVDSDFVSAEVTWHGRGNDSKRGEPITRELYSKSWLYVDGKPVVCDSRWMEVAALVTCISPTIPLGLAGTDSPELRTLQQSLLWLVYDQGFLSRYPMALGNLAYLEEVSPSEGRPSALALHEKAIEVAIRCYDNMYVYPYTRKGAYLCRSSRIKEALESWSQAAEVIRCYNYSRQDEEVYKEFLELANELIPTLMKDAASGINARSIINDPECFAALLRFYDGICQWEVRKSDDNHRPVFDIFVDGFEDSHTPVIHTGWARSLVHTFSRFDSTVRSLVRIVEDSDEWSEAGGSTSGASSSAISENPGVPRKRKRSERTMTLRGSDRALRGRRPASDPVGGVAKEEAGVAGTGSAPLTEGPVGSPCENNNSLLVQDNNSQDEEEDLPEIVKDYLKAHQGTEAPSPLLEEIALGCRDHVLNPFYLLGYEGETPFLDTKDLDLLDSLFPTASPPGPADPLQCLPSVSSISDSLSPCSVATPSPNGPAWSPTAPPKEETPNGPAWSPTATVPKEEHPTQDEFQLDRVFSQRPTIELHSRKMHGLKDLLFCRRLNAQAIQLQLTAQSQKEFQDLDNRFYSDLHSTSWLQLVSRCLTVAYLAAWNIQNGKSTVILTEEKAVDFAPLVASLTQLLLDRSSRTIQGFQSLIQKEWVSLGHPFRDRYGRAGSGDEYRAPIFHLFLDSVWQIMQQFPAAFSFSETYLTALADSLHISLFDTFLFNCDEERARYRKDHQLRARSVWSWGQQYSKPQQSHFRNPLTEVESLLNNRGRIREEENYIEEASMPTLRRKMRSQATPSFRASRARSLPAAQIETLMNIFKPIPQDPGRKEEELVVSNYPLKDNGQTRHRLAGLSIEWHLHSVLPVRPEVDQLQIWEQAYFRWIPKSAIQGGGPPIHRLFHLRMLEDIRSLVDLLDDSKRSPDGSPPVGFTKVVSTNGIISTAPFYPDSLEKPHTYISSKSEHSIKGKVELDVPETVYSLSDTSSPHVGNSSERIPSDLLMTLPVQR
ncbi:unnamed protein product [Cyprideis torosa]|uniref:Menin n=1 Tax=Cyprideis torosa TaxID=163714 RepID=A0A7R8W2S0_9CRUS|nr:unnamed protein product [Cyprideis torosa]CAG0882224.1 unnamed protein product [Cyprideis torosa]